MYLLKPGNMNTRIIAWYIGLSLLLISVLMAISGVIAFATEGDESRIPLLYATVITFLTGIFPLIFVRNRAETLRFKEGNCIVVGSWLFACLFGMIPYIMYGREFTPMNSLFESVSGFTTTGASILNDIEALPRGLQFWRISTAWAGGIGIVTLFSMIIAGSHNRSVLSEAEISDMAMQSVSGQKSILFANRMLVTYLALTILTLFGLKLTGMPWFDSATNAMSACSTCGFCSRNASIASYCNPAAEVVLTFAMLASGINFGILFLTFVKGSHRSVFNSEAIRFFLILVFVAICVMTGDLMIHDGQKFAEALRNASFQVASISTTTGFATQDTTRWPSLSVAILIICSLICGCSGSTSGGIKIDRVLLAIKGINRRVGLAINPRLVQAIRVDGMVRPFEHVADAFGYIFCYLVIMAIGAAVNIACGLDLSTGITASIACIGNVGPGFGDVGSMSNYAAVPEFVKFTSMLEMLIGRLEIFPVLYLFRSIRKPGL